jgi:magnesium transporter
MRPETVGDHLVTSVLRATPNETVERARARLCAEKPENPALVLVDDPDGRLAGVVPLGELLRLDAATALGEAIEAEFPRVTPEDDQEEAASLALHHGVDALPVVDTAGRALGMMPPRALLHVLRREHIKDLHMLAGIERKTAQARHAIEDPPLRRVRHRLPWLLVGLVGSAFATAAMASMEATFEKHIAVAFFVPGLVYLADAIGTQTETVAVRGLSMTRIRLVRLLAGELPTGMLIGAILAALSFVPILWAFGDLRLAASVGVSIVVAGVLANGIGLVLPWGLKRLRFDPAYGSGPTGTVLQDVCTILIYFAVLRAFGY